MPVGYVGQSVEARVNAQKIYIYKRGKLIAEHNRCYEQHKMITEISHYLPLIKYKPGALSGSYALAQARQKNMWPEIYDKYWHELLNNNEETDANRLFVDFLWWAQDFAFNEIKSVLKQTLDTGGYGLDSMKVIMRRNLNKTLEVDKLPIEDLGKLACYERPVGSISQYDSLIPSMGAQ